VDNPYAIERPHAPADLLYRQCSYRGFDKLTVASGSSPFKRHLSLPPAAVVTSHQRAQHSESVVVICSSSSCSCSSSRAQCSESVVVTDLYKYSPDVVPPIHTVSYHVATDKLPHPKMATSSGLFLATVYNQSQLAERKYVARYWSIDTAATPIYGTPPHPHSAPHFT